MHDQAAEVARLKLITDNAPVLLAYLDGEHRYRFVNAAYALRFGRHLDDMLGKTAADVLGEKLWAEIAPHRERVLAGEALEYEVDVEHRPGLRQRMHCVLNPACDADGSVNGYVIAITDVTDRRRVAEARELLAAIVDSSDDAIVSTDLEGRVTSWNPGAARLFGYTSEEMLGSALLSSANPEEADILDKVKRGGRVRHFETTRLAKDGRRLDISLSASPMRDHMGHVVGIANVARDVSEAKAAAAVIERNREALRESDRRKDEFLALLAHELRNPLATLVNALHLLRPASGQPGVERIRGMMERQLTQLERLVDDLLDVSRISRGRFELRRAPMSVVRAIETAIEGSQSLITSRGHELITRFPSEQLLVDGDFTRIAQVLANLLSNSAKYTEPGGRIEVELRREGYEAVVLVCDTGIGIPRQDLNTVFDMFSQVQDHKVHAGGGLGIGLALVHSLVEMHGGHVSVHSEGSGKGSTFIVRLPLLTEAPASSSAPGLLEHEATPQRARRILVADDNADAAASLALLLQTHGHETVTALNGVEAVEIARSFQPDIIFMDIGMPHLDGLEATRQIRAQPGGKVALIVALTGWGQDTDRRHTREAGMDLHFVKPMSMDRIAEVLERANRAS